MADLETRVDKLDERVSSLERQVSEVTVNVNGLIRGFQDFKEEMRQQNQMRAEDMREIRLSIDGMGKHVRNLALTAMGAIGAMVVTVIISLLKN
ncbi:MAG: hypothetical protein J5497_01770 [Selenomonadaceae bacterium]|jgi:predicted RNase H-like nuclease (RuvC/YqgF family)|nr:hypothetical protein [Selenomonadaceae bacterium]